MQGKRLKITSKDSLGSPPQPQRIVRFWCTQEREEKVDQKMTRIERGAGLPRRQMRILYVSWGPIFCTHPALALYLSGTSVWRPQSRYTVSHIECRIKFPQNQRCRAKIALHPPKSRCRTFLRTPLSHFPLIRSRQGVQRAGGGYRGTFGFRKRIALQGGIAATVTPVALLCATKHSMEEGKSAINLSNLGEF